MSKKIGYMRVSTDMQVHDLQYDALIRAGVKPEDIFSDTISGKTTRRDGLDKCFAALQTGDTFVVWKLDRVGRSVEHLKRIVTDLDEKGVGFESLQEKIDTSSAIGKLFFHLMAALAEFERDLIAERVRAGMAAAKNRGVKLGPPPQHEHLYPEIISMMDDGMTQREIAAKLSLSKTTVQRIGIIRDQIAPVPEMS